MRARPVDLARIGLGGLALARPDVVLDVVRSTDDRRARAVVRFLGARYVAQGAAGLVVDRSWVVPVDAAVDALHALSMVGAAALWPAHRRAALASAASASLLAAADLRHSRATHSESWG